MNREIVIIVGSTNPVKIEAVREAFERAFSSNEIKVLKIKVNSGVRPTPRNEEEIIKGALNRVKNIMKNEKGDFYVGLEGGIVIREGELFIKGWVAVSDGKITSLAATIELPLPRFILNELNKSEDIELEDIMEKISGIPDIGKKEGAIGFFTRGLYTRKDAFRDAVICALSKFLRKEFY